MRTRWIHARPTLLSPGDGAATGLSRQTRRRPARRRIATDGSRFRARLQPLAPESAFRAWLRSLHRQPWVVYAKPPFGSPAHVLHYLARYTHRVAISNHRLVAVTDDTVSFRWKDYRHGSQIRTLTLDADEFLRRFLLHVLPKRFVRIRYFGLLAPRAVAPADLAHVSHGPRRRATATARAVRHHHAALVALPALRRTHAHRRTADRASALSRGPPRRHSSMTARELPPRAALRLQSRSHARITGGVSARPVTVVDAPSRPTAGDV